MEVNQRQFTRLGCSRHLSVAGGQGKQLGDVSGAWLDLSTDARCSSVVYVMSW